MTTIQVGDLVECVNDYGSDGLLWVGLVDAVVEIDELGHLHLENTEDPESNWGGGWNAGRFIKRGS